MTIITTLKRLAVGAILALGAVTAAQATPGCVGKFWNPLTDLDYRLMGGIKIAGFKMMDAPKALGEPPKHNPKTVCFCKDGMQTGFGLGMSFWMPSYINDMARQAGCLGFLGGINVLKGFMSQSSGQEYTFHKQAQDGVTNMQVHWAYADVTALAGKSLFERCNAVTGAMSIAYMTEPDFIFQNDVYSVVMTPQASLLASAPLLSQMSCGFESVANTLGDWQDFGVCAWKGTRLPYSGNAIAKDSAQVTNMDVTVKYLTRSALLGTTLRTMGEDATCKPKYSPFYDPFQHRYQWSYPNKVSTRYNVDVVRWGMFIKDAGGGSMMSLNDQAAQLSSLNANVPANTSAPGSGTGAALGMAEELVARLPKPLNYPSREAGYMQVWEARQCCLMVFTLENIVQMIIENLATMGGGIIKQLYDVYNMANTAYQIIKDPIGGALGMVGDGIADMFDGAVTGIGDSIGSLVK